MESKIKKISRGEFEKEQTEIVFSTDQICMSVGEGELYEGSFIIENKRDENIRGLVYSSSFRVRSLEQGFDGNPVVIHYMFESMGMQNGDIEEGKFSVVCNGGEYEIPFQAVIERPYLMTEQGKIQSLSDFTCLAKQDYEEAGKVFWSMKFSEILKYEEESVANLYANMRTWSLDDAALEEFLVGSGEKARIELSFMDDQVEFENYYEPKEEMVIIRKNTWGFLSADISLEGEFLSTEVKKITTNDFSGTNFFLSYRIDEKKLHKGYNYGKIIMDTIYGRKEFEIVIHQESLHTKDHGKETKLCLEMIRKYMILVSGAEEADSWIEQTVKLNEELRELDLQNEYYLLLQAHMYLLADQKDQAKQILDQYHYNKFDLGKKIEIKLYYLFLNALINDNEAALKKTAEDINKAYNKNPDSWILLWMLIYADQKYKDYGERLELLQKYFGNGSQHLLIYIEAFLCYSKNNGLLKKLGNFEIKILGFAAKYGIITKEISMYAASLASQEKMFHAPLCTLLMRAYEIYEDPMILNSICMLLIKGNKIGTRYFPWYEKAVIFELKIAQLYEYYMYSMDDGENDKPLPRSVYLYFAHGNSLDYTKASYLYANILRFIDEDSELFDIYCDEIETFAWDQLLKRHVNENLKVIYKYFCCKEEMSFENMEAIYDISHSYHVFTTLPHIQYVMIIEKDGEIHQRVPYSEDGARVFLYSPCARIILESSEGFHFTESSFCYTDRLFQEPEFENICLCYEKFIQEYSETNKIDVNPDTVRYYGIEYFGEEEVLSMCNDVLNENGYSQDEFLLYLCVELLKRGYYDKETLTYLIEYYCSSTKDMYCVWKVAGEYGVNTFKLSERIITQMLFSESVLKDEEIFLDYYNGEPYFRLKLGYLAYVSKEYIVHDEEISEKLIYIILKEYDQIKKIADICKAAVLKFFAGHIPSDRREVLRMFLRDLCEKRMIFDFYKKYDKEWQQEVMLYDKVIIQYKAKEYGRVKLEYKIMDSNGEEIIRESEQFIPIYENIYVKEIILYEGEKLQYSVREFSGRKMIYEQEGECIQEEPVYSPGKYGRLNYMSTLQGNTLQEEMYQYKMEENLANELFVLY